jgi:hypothetical protein
LTTPSPVNLMESYQPGFNFLSAQCYLVASSSLFSQIYTVTGGTGTSLGPVPAPPLNLVLVAGQQVVCVINGFFTTPGAAADN